MKVAVVYNSLSGNTKKLAEGVFDKIPARYEKAIFKVGEDYDISEYDVVVPAFWIDKSFPNKPMKDFISSLENTKIFFMGTMGFFPDSQHGRDCANNTLSIINESCETIGYFICNGKVDMRLLERISKMKAETVGEKAFKAHMLDERNILKYKILGEHTSDLDVEYASARLNERLLMEEEIAKLEAK